MKPMKKIAILHSLCAVGKASLTNMLPIFSTMGIEACPIPTVLLSTHTGGYGLPARQSVSGEYIRACAEHYRDNGIQFDAIFVGYLGSEEMVSAVQYFLAQFPKAFVILDPIMGDHGTFYATLDQDYARAFRKLCAYVNVILPNVTEACFLAEKTYKACISEDVLKEMCDRLHDDGVQTVIMTSVQTEKIKRGILISSNETMELLEINVEPIEFHGTGDVFAAVLIGAYLQGCTWKESAQKAHGFVCECLRESGESGYEKRDGLLLERKLSLLV